MKTELTQHEKNRLIELGAKINNARAKGSPVHDDELIIYYELLNEYNRLKQVFTMSEDEIRLADYNRKLKLNKPRL